MSDVFTPAGGTIAVLAESVSPELARTLDLAGYNWKTVASADEAAEHEPDDGWAAAIVDCTIGTDGAWAFARTVRRADDPILLMVLVTGAQLADLELRDDLFDDFCLSPFTQPNSRRAYDTCSPRLQAPRAPTWSSTAISS